MLFYSKVIVFIDQKQNDTSVKKIPFISNLLSLPMSLIFKTFSKLSALCGFLSTLRGWFEKQK